MKEITKQKRLLKKEVFKCLETHDWSMYGGINDEVLETISICGERISKLLSEYFLNWNCIKHQRDEIILEELSNNYSVFGRKELRKLIVEYIKCYWNSELNKKGYGEYLSFITEIQDVEM
jgi:hypothetical protein